MEWRNTLNHSWSIHDSLFKCLNKKKDWRSSVHSHSAQSALNSHVLCFLHELRFREGCRERRDFFCDEFLIPFTSQLQRFILMVFIDSLDALISRRGFVRRFPFHLKIQNIGKGFALGFRCLAQSCQELFLLSSAFTAINAVQIHDNSSASQNLGFLNDLCA